MWNFMILLTVALNLIRSDYLQLSLKSKIRWNFTLTTIVHKEQDSQNPSKTQHNQPKAKSWHNPEVNDPEQYKRYDKDEHLHNHQ